MRSVSQSAWLMAIFHRPMTVFQINYINKGPSACYDFEIGLVRPEM